jgi:hypothetical protein
MLNGNLWNRLLVTPAFVGFAIAAAVPAIAAESSSKAADVQSANLQLASAQTAQAEAAQAPVTQVSQIETAQAEAPQAQTSPVNAALTAVPVVAEPAQPTALSLLNQQPVSQSAAVQPAVQSTEHPTALTNVASVASLSTAATSQDKSLNQTELNQTESNRTGSKQAATPATQQIAQAQPAATDSTFRTLDQIDQYTGNSTNVSNASPMGQVTSISQFSDVKPTDWAYQALQSLVERYGCIVGYPDRTYRGQRALTRFEFAAGLNACLDRISELIASSTADLATKQDLATLQRLQEEFAAELAALRGRVDALDSRVSELEANQFSTTTKLSGETLFSVADVFNGEAGSLNNTIFSYRTRLVFDTSFSGTDRLRARLQVGDTGRWNGTNSAGDTVLGNDGRLGYDNNTSGNIQLDILSYLFKVGPVSIMAAAQLPDFYEMDSIVNVVSPFASSGRGAISRFGRFNPIYRLGSGSGLGAAFNLGNIASIQLGYLAGSSVDSAGDPSPGAGLFNGDYAALGQIVFTPLKEMTLAFTYVNSYAGSDSTDTALGFNTGTGSTRSRVRVGGQPVVSNSYGAELNFRVANFLQIGGWIGYSAVRVLNTGDAQVWNYAGTIGFPDLGKKGSLLGFVVGVEPYLGGTSGFNVGGRRGSDYNGLHVEGFYRFQLNDNISITPGVIWLTAPNQNNNNDDAIIGAIRTTFTF